jgi:tRNA(fMet)-specific endonuclease VapC
MLQYLLDTDHLTLLDHADTTVWQQYSARPWGAVGICAVTVEEYLRGRLAVLSRHTSGPLYVQVSARLVESVEFLQQFPVVPFDQACEGRYQQLRKLRLRVGSQDLRIAPIGLEHRLIVVTRNQRDFAQVPGLVLEDWSV